MANEKTWHEMSEEERLSLLETLHLKTPCEITTTGGNWTMGNIVYRTQECVPYQMCPKCNGQGIVSKPPYIAGDVYHWSGSASSFTCDVCNGAKIIPMHHIQEPVSAPFMYSPNNEPLKPTTLEWLILKTTVDSFESDSKEYTNLIGKFRYEDFEAAQRYVSEQTKGQYCLRVIAVLGISFE